MIRRRLRNLSKRLTASTRILSSAIAWAIREKCLSCVDSPTSFTSWVTSKLARQRIPDSQCGFRLLRRSVLKDYGSRPRAFETETEMLIQAARAGHRIISIPIRTIYESDHASHVHSGA